VIAVRSRPTRTPLPHLLEGGGECSDASTPAVGMLGNQTTLDSEIDLLADKLHVQPRRLMDGMFKGSIGGV